MVMRGREGLTFSMLRSDISDICERQNKYLFMRPKSGVQDKFF